MEWSQARERVISPWENEEEKGEEKREMEEADHHPGNYNHLCILPEQPVHGSYTTTPCVCTEALVLCRCHHKQGESEKKIAREEAASLSAFQPVFIIFSGNGKK